MVTKLSYSTAHYVEGQLFFSNKKYITLDNPSNIHLLAKWPQSFHKILHKKIPF